MSSATVSVPEPFLIVQSENMSWARWRGVRLNAGGMYERSADAPVCTALPLRVIVGAEPFCVLIWSVPLTSGTATPLISTWESAAATSAPRVTLGAARVCASAATTS